MSSGELIIYTTEDGSTTISLRTADGNVWLSQKQMSELFQKDVRTINEHILNVLEESELPVDSTIRNFRIVQIEGQRQVEREIAHYNLDMIIAVGYRVKSYRGTQFRQWATTHLREYLVKGFVMDDERLKNPGGWDYFDELLARIREIRASEKRFYQKIRDLFALSQDYRADDREAQIFFAEVQNKLLFAVTGKTAAETVVSRADPKSPNMALTSWSGSRVRRQDVIVAKNYLTHDEVDTLNRLVVIFLEQAELRVKDRKELTLNYWRQNVDRLLEFNERPVLDHAGKISADEMKQIVTERYEVFDSNRRLAEALEADAEDIKELEEIERKAKKKKDSQKE